MSTYQRWLSLPLAIVGVQTWLVFTQGRIGMLWHLAVLVIVPTLVAFIPPLRQSISRLLNKRSNPTPKQARWIACTVGLLVALYLWGIAVVQKRDFAPTWADEYHFLLLARFFASGVFALPAHPLADFFDSYYILTDPVYASQAFPGFPLLLVPALWLGLPTFLVPLTMAAIAAGLLYRIVTELMDGTAGLLAVVMLMSNVLVRMTSILHIAQMPALALGLLLIWTWMKWRASRSTALAIIMGACAALLCITRPADAVAFIIPVAIAILLDLRKVSGHKGAAFLMFTAIGAMPFVIFQLALNRSVTGSVLKTPSALYGELDQPGVGMRLTPFNPTVVPTIHSKLPQKIWLYDEIFMPVLRNHNVGAVAALWRDARVMSLFGFRLLQSSHRADWILLLLIFVPVGMLGLKDTRALVMGGTVAAFIVVYSFYPFSNPHYHTTGAPGIIVLVLIGLQQVQRALARDQTQNTNPRLGPVAATFMLAMLVPALIPESRSREFQPDAPDLRRIDRALAQVESPAVVLITPGPQSRWEFEPVYNLTTANIDDAPVIRAHDLGDRNAEIFAYYAQRSPKRKFYRYDRATDQLEYLGWASDLRGK